MNNDQMQGNWEKLKGKIKQTWGKLTDDDIALYQGNTQEFFGRVQEQYGLGREEAEKHMKTCEKSCGYNSKAA